MNTMHIFFHKRLTLWFIVFIISTKGYSQNYDEAKVPSYSLPSVLKMSSRKTVAKKWRWEKTRRPEILKLFEDNVYGQMPKSYDNIVFNVTKQDASAMDGKATLKEVDVTTYKAGKSVTIHLTMFIPNSIKKPVATFLLINNRGKENTDPTRKNKSDFWPAEMLIESGYAIAAFHNSDAAPDDKTNYVNGALQLYLDQLTKDNGMKAIGAWAWGASRVLDYFEKDKDIDAKKVFVVGHSRGGKAALWAGAQDQRFAMVFSNCSGNTGAALSRRRFGETVNRINTTFPHWFSNNYKKYNNNVDSLPVDQHMLLSLIAPRPVYVTSATKDLWADPKGSYLSLKNAEPVYALYKKTSALTPEPPAVNTPIIHSSLGYHNREGEHNLTAYDWSNFIKFADYHFRK